MQKSLAEFIQSAPCQHIFKWIENQHSEMIETVERWSRINSGSRNLSGLATMATESIDFAASLDATVNHLDLDKTPMVSEDGHLNQVDNGQIIQFIKRPTANRRLLLTGHLDTVFPSDHPFQTPQWLSPTVLNGPGVADMKGGIIVMLTALKAFEQSQQASAVGWEVLLSPDEETGSLASAPVLMDRARRAHMGLTYEPAMPDGSMAGQRKGSGNYTVIVRGKAAHAGREFHSGRNAVVFLSQIIEQLAALTGQRPGLTVNPAVINGGSAANVVPDYAKCIFNVRLETLDDQDWLQAAIDALIKKANSQDGFTVELHGGINRPPKEITPANQKMMDLIAAVGSELDMQVTYKPTGGCCEGNNLAAAGLPNVDTLGIVGGNIHSSDEYGDITSFVPRAKLSAAIMLAFAAGYFDSVFTRTVNGQGET